MSVYYYLGCDECKVMTTVISKGRTIWFGDDVVAHDITKLLTKHVGHPLCFFSEYDESRENYEEISMTGEEDASN